MNEKDKLSVSYACLRSLADTAASGTGAPGGGRCPRRRAGPWGAGRAPGCRREPGHSGSSAQQQLEAPEMSR